MWAGMRHLLLATACAAVLYAPSPTASALTGDIDGSGVVDAVDIQLVILAVLGQPIPYDADVDGVPGLTATDIQLVVNAGLGVVTEAPPAPVRYSYTVVNVYPHDPAAFTQGLVIDEGRLYESTGLYGQSSLREVRLSDGEVLRKRDLANNEFGEGITVNGDRIVLLTWQNKIGHVYEKNDFTPAGNFTYNSEGWGITTVGDRLVMSDGTGTLRWLDPATLAVTGSVAVTENGNAISRLNELEYIDGEIWANIWLTDRVVRIDPATGYVTGTIDFGGLLTPAERKLTDVLNGIAYDAQTGKIYVTGKKWPKVFEVTVSAVE